MAQTLANGVDVVQGKVKSVIIDSIKAAASEDGVRRISGYASTPSPDRGGDVVEVVAFATAMTEFMKNPVMLWQHSMSMPIGVWDQFEIRQDGLWVSGTLVPGVPEADKAWALITHQAVRSLSIGFRELSAGPEEDGFWHIKKLELFEVSVVTVPMNAEARFTVDKGGKLLDIQVVEEAESRKDQQTTEDTMTLEEVKAAVVEALAPLRDEFAAVKAEFEEKLQTGIAATTMDINQKFQDIVTRVDAVEQKATDVEKCFTEFIFNEVERLAEAAGVSPEPPAQ